MESYQHLQSDLLNSNSLNSSFLLNSSGKFDNFVTITTGNNVKSTFQLVTPVSSLQNLHIF